MDEVCGTCKWNVYNTDDGYCCGNDESEAYGIPTAYDDTCDDWEEKES